MANNQIMSTTHIDAAEVKHEAKLAVFAARAAGENAGLKLGEN
jgi:hypothetical protein